MTNTIVEVSDCLRLDTGNVSVLGTVTSLSRLYKMLKSVNYYCSDCGFSDTELFDPVVDISDSNLKPIIKSSKKCKCEILIRPTFDYVNAVTIELQDSDDLKETEKLLCILFEENTRDIRVGEKVMISGNVQVIIKNKKAVTCLYSTAIKYENKKDIQVTELDKKAIQRFVDKKKENTIDELVKMFAVNTIGYNIVKKGLLLSAVSSGIDKKYENGLGNRERIHVIIVGDPGIGKSNLLRESIKLVPNSRYESGQHSSGKSLTAIVTKENEEYFLRYGSISLSNGAICALNEIGRMNFEDQGFLLDVMEEGSFTINKYGINARIKSSTVIVATSNPLGSTWNKNTGFDSNGYDDDNGKIDLSKIPLLNPVLDRFDLVFVVQTIKDEQEYRKYAQIKTIQVSDPKLIPTYYPYLKKHIQYAKSFSPSLTEEASTLIREYYINLAKSSSNHFGSSKRTLEKLIRISKSIAKIKLKNKVDVDDAKEALEFFNAVILQYESAVIAIPPNPSDLTLSMFVDLLKESSFPHTLEELARKACEKNEFIRSYLASDDKHTSNKNKFQISNNKKLRNIYNILADNPSIQVLSAKPIVLRWKPLHLNYRANLSDSSDLYDPNSVISTNSEDNEEMNRRDDDKDNSTIDVKSTYIFQDKKNLRSDESYRSDSIGSQHSQDDIADIFWNPKRKERRHDHNQESYHVKTSEKPVHFGSDQSIIKASYKEISKSTSSEDYLYAIKNKDDLQNIVLNDMKNDDLKNDHSNNLFSSDKKNKLIYSCYLCGLETDSKEEYERHYVRTHPGKPAYPCLADITKYGLEPQGKSWE